MLDAGVYPPPSQYEAWFVSAAHDEADGLGATLDSLQALRCIHEGPRARILQQCRSWRPRLPLPSAVYPLATWWALS